MLQQQDFSQSIPNIDIDQLILQEESRRMQEDVAMPQTPVEELFDILKNDPSSLTESKELFKKACENLLWIATKNRGIQKFKLNLSQRLLLDAYFEMKSQTPVVRINILKGRQQGMSTAIGAFAVIEMLAHRLTNALISSEKKEGSGKNIFLMYDRYLKEFDKMMKGEINESDWLYEGKMFDRFAFGEECAMYNDSKFNVVSQGLVTSQTIQFVHLSEAAFFHDLGTYMGMLMQTVPKTTASTMFIESTAKMYGNHHYDEWMAACADESAFRPLFLPWYCHEEYQVGFADDEEKEKFIASLGVSDEHQFGNEKELMTLNTEGSEWRRFWHTLDFEGQDQVTLENLKWRRIVVKELKGSIPEFNRQYPTTPEMAFLSSTDHVLDISSVRWYKNTVEPEPQIKEPRRCEMVEAFEGINMAKLLDDPRGVIAVWEEPIKYCQYTFGIDPAEGRDSGDYCVGYMMKRHPRQIVARLRGYQGRMLTLRDFARQAYWLGKYYNNADVCAEINGIGGGFANYLLEWGYPAMMPDGLITGEKDTGRWGWMSTGSVRGQAISGLQEIIHDKAVGIPCEMLIDEMHHFVWVNGRAQAARKRSGGSEGSTRDIPGGHDDCIFAFIGCLLADKALPSAQTRGQVMEAENLSRIRMRQKQENIDDSTGSGWLKHV